MDRDPLDHGGQDPSLVLDAQLTTAPHSMQILDVRDVGWMPGWTEVDASLRMDRMAGLSVRGLLFTDIEGSTSLVRRLGRGFDALLERHQEIIRSAVGPRLGVEQSREGDSMFITFPSPSAAVEGAVEAQRQQESEVGRLIVGCASEWGYMSGRSPKREPDWWGSRFTRRPG